MGSKNLSASLLLIVFASVFTSAQDNPFLGKWNITGTGQYSNFVYWLEVKMEDDKLVGYFLNRGGSVTKLPEIAIQNGELVFSPASRPNAPKPVHRAKVEESRLLGLLTEGDREIAWIGVRPPKWGVYNANGRHKLGTPVNLFDGKTIDNWGVQRKDQPSGWSVVDGVMTNEAKANNLVTKHRFENFKIRCEYKIEEKSNSGIYLRGRYELQVLDDAGKEPESHGHMALYSRVKPLVNASLPAGQWQVMEATIVGNRLTVFLNSKKVHDNIVIEGITGGALDSNEIEPGPIMLQGDHGKVWFRKVVVTPILK
ncbi:MAG: DUF1080 domain-containing protein [Acidobacteria bacterium]|nr:DUF1080 domain-containing protein [Acidobacteriota bacterium]MCI0665567.1 DUF1080 domain-containing protein [Acidobacteriota bacterium]